MEIPWKSWWSSEGGFGLVFVDRTKGSIETPVETQGRPRWAEWKEGWWISITEMAGTKIWLLSVVEMNEGVLSACPLGEF